jgi:BASS family bile acid:Na+ symporter
MDFASDFGVQVLLPLGLFAVMFSLGLALNILDLHRLLQSPKPLIIGLCAHMIGLPAIAFLLTFFMDLPPEIALIIVIIAACPGGVTSNILTFAGRGDIALSISITAVSSMVCVVTIPILVNLAAWTFFGTSNVVSVSAHNAIRQLFSYMAVPVGLGLMVRLFLPTLAQKLLIYLRPTSFGVLLTIIACSLQENWHGLTPNNKALIPVMILNFAAVGLGLGLAHVCRLQHRQRKTIAIGVGIQNATLASFIAISLLNRIDLMGIPVLYGTTMLLTGLAVIYLWDRYGPKAVA